MIRVANTIDIAREAAAVYAYLAARDAAERALAGVRTASPPASVIDPATEPSGRSTQ